jgi:CRISPR-associated exonuclease Cas4
MIDPILLNVGDLKQWVYCPRVVFYHRFAPNAGVPTAKMQIALKAQEQVEPLESRRSLKPYGLDAATRIFGPWLSSPDLGIQGKPDLILESSDRIAVVDFKLTAGEATPNLQIQLAAYSLIAEQVYQKPASVGFIYRIPDSAVLPVPISLELRQSVLDTASAIRAMISSESLPDPTDFRKRCEDCEFANFCADIW